MFDSRPDARLLPLRSKIATWPPASGGEPLREATDVVIAGVLDDLLGKRGERAGVALERRVERVVLVACVDERKGKLEQQQHHRHEDEVADRAVDASLAVCPSRKPTLCTFSMKPGWPSFLRSDATCTSRVLVGPYQWGSHTSSMICWRLTTAPGSSPSSASRSNSFG